MKYLNTILCSILLISCASNPDKIKAQISPLVYQSYTCEQLVSEHDRLIRHLNQAYDVQKKKSDGDSAKVGVGLVLFWPTLFFTSGDGESATEYSRLKGEFNSLEEAFIKASCSTSDLSTSKITQKAKSK